MPTQAIKPLLMVTLLNLLTEENIGMPMMPPNISSRMELLLLKLTSVLLCTVEVSKLVILPLQDLLFHPSVDLMLDHSKLTYLIIEILKRITCYQELFIMIPFHNLLISLILLTEDLFLTIQHNLLLKRLKSLNLADIKVPSLGKFPEIPMISSY